MADTPRGLIKGLLNQPGSSDQDRSRGRNKDDKVAATPKTLIAGSTRKQKRSTQKRDAALKKNATPRTLINEVLGKGTPGSVTADRSKAPSRDKTLGRVNAGGAQQRRGATPRSLLGRVLQNTTPATVNRQPPPAPAPEYTPNNASLVTPSMALQARTPLASEDVASPSFADRSEGSGADMPSFGDDDSFPVDDASRDEDGFALPNDSLSRRTQALATPAQKSESSQGTLVQIAKLRTRRIPTLTPRKAALPRTGLRAGPSTLRATSDAKRKTKSVGLSSSFTRTVFTQFANMGITKPARAELDECLDQFFRQVADDLHAYAGHGKHQSSLSVADVRCLLKRQRRVVGAGPGGSLEALCHELLPLEYTEELIPIARLGNKVSLA